MRTTAMWLLLGVLVLLGYQPSEAGTGDHAQARKFEQRHVRTYDRYVAIGDSYTAGSGIAPHRDSGCLRSARNYPNRLADRLGAKLVDVSCGGAWTVNLEMAQPTGVGSNVPQLLPVGRRTDLVTVSLGINDAGFGSLLERCAEVAAQNPAGAPCRASYQDAGGDTVLAALPAVGQRVQHSLTLIKQRAPRADVVLVGYPQLVPESGTCPAAPFAAGDYVYIGEFMAGVDATLEAAARAAKVPYVSLLDASIGHDVCAGRKAWVLGAIGDPRTMVWHPFGREQRAVTSLILDKLGQSSQRPDR